MLQVAKLVDDFGMVSFTPLDISDEDRYVAAACCSLGATQQCLSSMFVANIVAECAV